MLEHKKSQSQSIPLPLHYNQLHVINIRESTFKAEMCLIDQLTVQLVENIKSNENIITSGD